MVKHRVYTENSLHCLVLNACKTNMDVIMDNYMLNFKDFILFIPLNVFNDIALFFDIFIQLRANQRLATEHLLKERLDSIAFAISIDRITLLILGQNATLCCLLLLKLKVPNFDVTRYRAVVVRCCLKLIDLIYWHQINGTAINVCCRQGLYRYNYTVSSLCSELFIPPATKLGGGGILESPCPSVRLSVCRRAVR